MILNSVYLNLFDWRAKEGVRLLTKYADTPKTPKQALTKSLHRHQPHVSSTNLSAGEGRKNL